MKYSNKITNRSFSLLIVFTICAILFILFLAVIAIFPIQFTSQDIKNNNQHSPNFFTFWPESPLKQEMNERKKIKRYTKAEQQRRFEKRIKMMGFLNAPIYDIWFDQNIEIIANQNKNHPDDSSFFWPILPNISYTFNEPQKRSPQFVILPDSGKVNIRKGIYIGSGESIKSNLPVANAKKYIALEVLPLSPGRIKVALGEYVWTKTFAENEIHTATKFFIPINDSLAQNYKVSNISSSMYVIDLKVIIVTENGREPIYLSQNSQIWHSNPLVTPQTETKDFLTEIANENRISTRETTLTKGYNILVLSIEGLDFNPFENNLALLKEMPDLQNLSANSFVIKNSFDTTQYETDRFKIPVIYKKYGYRTALFTNAKTLLLDDGITLFKDFDTIKKSWLVQNDADLVQQFNRNALNKTELEGLNAIFKIEDEEQPRQLDEEEFTTTANYLGLLSRFAHKPHNFIFDDNFLISEKNYTPNLLDSFQGWSMAQKQSRLYIDMTLALNAPFSKITLQDLMITLLKKPTKLNHLHKYMQMRILDRELKHVLESIQSSAITNRTIVIALFKNKINPMNGSALLFVPGLQASASSDLTELSSRDILFYTMSVIGIPAESTINFAQQYKNLETKQNITLPYDPQSSHTEDTKYNLVIYPHKNNCEPFIWQAVNNTNIVEIKSNLPSVSLMSSNVLEFFPCSFGEKVLKIEWKQVKENNLDPTQIESTNHIYGYFTPVKKNTQTSEFYYGKKLVNHMNLPLNFTHTPEQINDIFMVDKKEIDQLQSVAIKSFEIMRLDSKLTQNTRAALFISKVLSE